MAPPPLAPILTTEAPSRPTTPTNGPASAFPSTPPPTFSISPAAEDSNTSPGLLSPVEGGSPRAGVLGSPTRAPWAGSEPPSPSGSSSGVGGTTLGLRNNIDPDGTRVMHENEKTMLGLSYPPSSQGSSDGDEGKHRRRPSGALSFTSTIADTKSEGDHQSHAPVNVAGEVADDEDVPAPRKWLGIFPRAPKAPLAPTAIPDPSPEEMAPFSTTCTPSALYSMFDPKSYSQLTLLRGTQGLLDGLRTSRTGLADVGGEAEKDFEERRRVWGINRTPTRAGKSFLQLCWLAYQDKVLIILSVAAAVSLALGLYQDFGTPPTTYASTSCPNNLCVEPAVDWVEGVAITIAIFIVILVGALNDYQKEQQFRKLNAQKEERSVKALRNGTERLISIYDVLVGDTLFLEPGEIFPVDGVLLEGHNIRCDESGATGESDAVRKVVWDEMSGKSGEKVDCFLLSGSKVLEGVGTYVVTGVGQNSFHGKIMMSLRGDAETTPLQLKLNALAELIAKLGSAAGLILFSCLMIRFFVQLVQNADRTAQEKAQNFIQILIISVTVVVVAVPEGLPLAVTLALAFATKRMARGSTAKGHKGEGRLLVRVLSACETSATMTVLCTDKTGTLTQNEMSVVAGSIGVHLKFADRLAENAARSNANDDIEATPASPRVGRTDFSTDMTDVSRHLSPSLATLFNESICINSTAFEGVDDQGKETGFVGSKTETALLAFAKAQGWADYKSTRTAAKVVHMIPFSSERKAMGVVIELPGGGYRLLIKGASEVLAKISNRHVVVVSEGLKEVESGTVRTEDFTDETRSNINRTIIFYANQSLRTIALCSRDLPRWPPLGAQMDESGAVEYADLARDLTLVAITAIEDPLREGVSVAVDTCQKAGVSVKMCTGDNVLTARSIATQCGIYTPGGIIMEGSAFRKLTVAERNEIVPRLQVLARSSPEDKKILVEHLKSMGEVVGVTGDGTNDGPALKTANVGFSMGIAGTEVAKEASDIIIMDDDFASIVSAIMWGRCVNDSVKKFLQFQISVNITAVLVTFISAVASSDETSVLSAVQLLWVNLIMDTFAALALATDPADPESLKRKPDRKTSPLISCQMWMMIFGQAIFQIIVALTLHFGGRAIFGLYATDIAAIIDQENELSTLVFNTFVFCQIFNMFNARRLDRGLNVFVGVFKNKYFLVIFLIMVGGQILIVQVGGAAFHVVPIGGRDWAVSLVLGSLSMPLAVLIRLLPPAPFERFMIRCKFFPDPNAVLPTVSPASDEKQWNEGIEKVIDNLNIYSQIRGGRLRSSSIVRKSRSRQLADADIHPSALMAMVPSLIMGSIGAGWKPTSGSLSDPAGEDPSKSSVQLFSGRPQAHPETDKSDHLAMRYNGGLSPAHSRNHSVASGHSRASSLSNPRGEATLAPPSPMR